MAQQGFQKIGNLTPDLSKLDVEKDTPTTKPDGQQVALQTTGERTANSKRTGTAVSTIGSVRTLLAGRSENGERVSPGVTTRAIKALLKSHTTHWRDDQELVNLVYDAAMPLNSSDMAQELTKLAMLTKRRNDGDTDTALLISAYAEKLIDYPADVVRHVLAQAAKESVFFPAWSELYESLEFWGRDRLNLRSGYLGKSNDDETDHRP